MNTYKKTFSASAVLISALLVISCGQSPDQQTGNAVTALPVDDTSTVTTNNVIKGSYLALSSSEINVYKGEAFTLDITVNDFTTSEGGSVTLLFDPTLLQVVKVDVDSSVWDFVNKNGQINNVGGSVSDIIFSSYQGVSGDAKVATIEFKSINNGTSEIILKESSANPFASNGLEMVVSFKSASVVVN